LYAAAIAAGRKKARLPAIRTGSRALLGVDLVKMASRSPESLGRPYSPDEFTALCRILIRSYMLGGASRDSDTETQRLVTWDMFASSRSGTEAFFAAFRTSISVAAISSPPSSSWDFRARTTTTDFAAYHQHKFASMLLARRRVRDRVLASTTTCTNPVRSRRSMNTRSPKSRCRCAHPLSVTSRSTSSAVSPHSGRPFQLFKTATSRNIQQATAAHSQV